MGGIEATAEALLTKGSFAVVKVTIKHCDLEKVLSAKMGEKKASRVGGILHFAEKVGDKIGVDVSAKVDAKVGSKILDGLCEKLPEVLPEKMSEKGLIVDVCAKKDAEEEKAYLMEVF